MTGGRARDERRQEREAILESADELLRDAETTEDLLIHAVAGIELLIRAVCNVGETIDATASERRR